MRETPRHSLFQAGLAIRFPPMSVEEISRNAQAVGWELYYTQLDPRPFRSLPFVVHTANLQLGLTEYGGGAMIVGAIPRNCVMLCFAADDKTVCNYHNRRLEPYEVFLATGRDELDFVHNAPSTLLSITLEKELFARRFLDHFGVEWREGEGTGTFRLDAEGVKRFMPFVRGWIARFFEPYPLDYEAAEEALLERFFSLLRYEGARPIKRAPLSLKRAREILHEQAGTYYTIAQLARETGLSQRNLQYLFKKHLGVSPKSYYLGLKFRRIREEILEAGASVPLGEIALRHGFYHAGHFSAVYRRFFGELPSETLRKRGGLFRFFATDSA